MEELAPQLQAASLCAERLEIRWHRAGLRYRFGRRDKRGCERRRPLLDKYKQLGEKLERTNEALKKYAGTTFNVAPARAKLYLCLDGIRKGKIDLLFKVKRVPCGIARLPVDQLLEKLSRVPTLDDPLVILGMSVTGLFQFDGRQKAVKVVWLKHVPVLAEFKKKIFRKTSGRI